MALPVKLKDILAFLGKLAPWDLAESWDNVGLMVGDPDQDAAGVLVALDPSLPVLEEAISRSTNIIVTHHPLIFHPLKSINTATSQGQFIQKALQNDISVISCHTNLDVIADGVSDALASTLGIQQTKPLTQSGTGEDQGFGKIGVLPEPMGGTSFLRLVAEKLQLTGLTAAGTPPESVTTVAVCGGSGSDLAEAAFNAGAQVYITAELKHSISRWAEENEFCIIDGSHFATENVIIPKLISELTSFLGENINAVPVVASKSQHNPLRFYNFQDMNT